eukprot:5501862-Amphidinium_carterae.1
MQVWQNGKFPPVQTTTCDLGVDTQWFAWRNLAQQKRISSFRVSMNRTSALGLPAGGKAEADDKVKCKEVAEASPDFQTLRQLMLDGQSPIRRTMSNLRLMLLGVVFGTKFACTLFLKLASFVCSVEDLEHI